MSLARTVIARYVGRVSYQEGLRIQNELADLHRLDLEGDSIPDVLLLCQHNPVYTLGRRLSENEIDAKRLGDLGAEYYATGRGGHITFHGPGQLVGYPILNLRKHKKSVKWYVGKIEDTVVSACGRFGVEACPTVDTGVWIGNNKIAAIGVSVSRWVTQHGFALNCNTDLSWFSHIVPCGLANKGVTSLSEQTKRTVDVAEAIPQCIAAFGDVFERDMVFEDVSKQYEDSTNPVLFSPLPK